MALIAGFERAFEPRSIAIVGVSRSEAKQHPVGGTGLGFLRTLHRLGYQGRIYPINRNASEIDGIKAYPSVASVPELLDLVIVAVPAAAVLQVLYDCIVAGALNVHVCTSGFSETGEEPGRSLEQKVRQTALQGGLRLLGPNCMGLQVPRARIGTFDGVSFVDGPVAFLSQSGGHARKFLQYGPQIGVGFSKIISYGNAAVMDATDLLEYLVSDPLTKVICMYLEGTRQGNLLTRMVRQANLVKPVVVWKGGLTESGARAAASHTGSMSGNRQIWDAFFRQTGAIRVGSIEEMAEVSAALVSLPPSAGTRAAVIGGGGGNNVATGDICAEEGIQLPPPSGETKQGLGEFLSSVNQGLTNPLDAPDLMVNPSLMGRAVKLFADDPAIDMIIVNLMVAYLADKPPETVGRVLDYIAKIARDRTLPKPLIVTLSDPTAGQATASLQQIIPAGILWYPSLRQTCRAVSRYAAYYEFVGKSGDYNVADA